MTQRTLHASEHHTRLRLVDDQTDIDARARRSLQAARASSLIRRPNRFMPEVGQGMACLLLGIFDLCLIGYLIWLVLRRH